MNNMHMGKNHWLLIIDMLSVLAPTGNYFDEKCK